MSIVTSMSKLKVPGTAASSLKKCTTRINDHGQTEIVDYGIDLNKLDTFLIHTTMEFNRVAAASYTNSQQPSPTQVADLQKLADQLKNMTPDQQKAYAMQMAQKQMNTPHTQPLQDDAATYKLVSQTNQIGAMQMKSLNDEFSKKLAVMDNAMSQEIKALPVADKTKCPQDQTGTISCACANKLEGEYWQQVVKIENKYAVRKSDLLQSYLDKLKGLAGAVDANIDKLKNGDAIKSAQLKQMLYTAQSSAFSNAFTVTARCIEDIRKGESDALVNKINCDKNVYDLSCD